MALITKVDFCSKRGGGQTFFHRKSRRARIFAAFSLCLPRLKSLSLPRLSDGVMVAQSSLEALVMVRIHVGQPLFLNLQIRSPVRKQPNNSRWLAKKKPHGKSRMNTQPAPDSAAEKPQQNHPLNSDFASNKGYAGFSHARLETDPTLADVEQNWNGFGKYDPLWAILGETSKKNNQWDLADFFATGEHEIANVLQISRSLKPSLGLGKALDFGCGVGRLTQALCRQFEECHGVDIAESMVEQARHYNRHGDKCHYHVNKQTNLKLFADNTFDFIYTNIVLQHNRPENCRRFIQDFIRILKPDGLLVFQMPSEPVTQSPDAGQLLFERDFKAQLTTQLQNVKWIAGTSESVAVKIKNLSNRVWPGKIRAGAFPLRLANHWRDSANRMLIRNASRVDLPQDLHPGEEIELTLTVSVPVNVGNYRLELDLLQERWFWFGDRDSQTALMEVVVAEGSPPSAPAAKPEVRNDFRQELETWFQGNVAQPLVVGDTGKEVSTLVMEMNGIPKEEMLAFLANNGGQAIKVEPDASAGPWFGFRYFVTKTARG